MKRYAPGFVVAVGGRPLPPALRASVTAIRYQDGLEGANRLEVSIADERLRWLDDPLLAVDAPVELSLGYAGDPLEIVFTGEITGVDAAFPSSGAPSLTVVAHDFMQRMTIGAKDRAFAISLPCIGKFPLPDPVIAAAVSATDLLVPVIDPVGAALSFLTLLATYAINPADAAGSIRIQQGQSDFDFLSAIARENGWDMFIDHSAAPRGHVLRLQFTGLDAAPTATLRWGESIVDFSPRITTVGQVATVSTRIWVSATNTEWVVALGWDYDRSGFDLQVYPGLGYPEAARTGTLTVDADGPATAPRKILGELIPRLNNRLTGSGTAIGDTRIKAGRLISLDGLGARFGGLYRVTQATHTVDASGYRTAFEVRKEVWFE
ncbi:hypothetical protein ABGB18_28250 [Nonomuraea sp. B12E4]|uniref:phage late control D family protein n=1 Tax=Nonomuraea sp. B12E4 TaxID=3153564 RepID=UPI00325F01B8